MNCRLGLRSLGPLRMKSTFSSAFLVMLFLVPGQASATTYSVCPSGCDYTSINTAVDAVLGPGVTINVSPGTYREQVTIESASGSQGSPGILRANGGVVIVDGADPFDTLWTACSGYANTYHTPRVLQAPEEQPLFIDDIQYIYRPAGFSDCILQEGEFSYDTTAHAIYVRVFGNGDPASHTVLIRQRSIGIDISASSYITLSGITVLRTKDRGIRVHGPDTTSRAQFVTVTGCVSAYNARSGIYLDDTRNCSVIGSTSYSNGRHGIYLLHTDNCAIANNASYRNRNPAVLGISGSQTGIKVGDSSDSTDVSVVTVENNIIHDNQDSGVDLKGSRQVIVRNNVSYRNGDHGYDNNVTSRTAFVNNVAARNDHDGISVENTSRNVTIANCVFANNGVNPITLNAPGYVAELQVFNTTGFTSDHNVIVGLPALDTVHDGSNYYRRLIELPSSQRWTTFSGYVDSAGLDVHSKGFGLAFLDSTNGVFRPRFSSSAIDAADSTVYGWVTTDLSGVARHDCSGKTDTGYPAGGAYADVGALEYDDGMSAIDAIFNYNTVDVTLVTYGRYGNASWQPDSFQVMVDNVVKVTRRKPFSSPADGWPAGIGESVSASACHEHSVVVRMFDEYGDTALTNVVDGETCCEANCYGGRPGIVARRARKDEGDVPFALQWPGGNPSIGKGIVAWSIPRAQAGSAYELALFDIAGRRIATIARGTAQAGKFTEEVVLGREEVGVFFIRLRVGNSILSRRIVVVQ
jgi:parallel beta-helix repeat protein